MRWLFRRVFWVGTGASLGFGGAMWIRRKLQRALERVMPPRVSQDIAQGARHVGGTVRGAVTDGRAAMKAREAELRRDYAPGRR
jgi:hypothetical protein